MKTRRRRKTSGKSRKRTTRRKTSKSKKTTGLKKARLKRTIQSLKSNIRLLEKEIR